MEPRLIEITNGWLAMTPPGVLVQFSVSAPTEAEARSEYAENLRWWRSQLGPRLRIENHPR